MTDVWARVKIMVQDPSVANIKGLEPIEGVEIRGEDFFLDGPVSRRVAVLDFDPATGALVTGVPFTPPKAGGVVGRFEVELDDLRAPAVMQTNVFGVVMQTLRMFEEPSGLGRRMRWAFDGPQLLVVPRAGEWANAFYERESHSLQFFYFDERDKRIFTCLSRDIVAHETGHAILDGIAPDLYDAVTPHSLALHEAIADIVALLVAFRSRQLSDAVLREQNGSIEKTTAFSSIAEEFGMALRQTRKSGPLRDLLNDKTLADVSATEPHELSEVLTGALYTVMVALHGQRRDALVAAGSKRLEASGEALREGAELFKRLVLRPLDYLPPGEVSFGDYGRALYAADLAAYPGTPEHRDRVAAEFVRRGIAAAVAELADPAPEVGDQLDTADVPSLLSSDFAAYQFADEHRDLLRIPWDAPYRVLPRARVSKQLSYATDSTQRTDELIFKVSWDHIEPNAVVGLPGKRQVTAGTTLVLDWETRTVRAVLSSDLGASQAHARDAMIRRLVDTDSVALDEHVIGLDGRPRSSVVEARTAGGVLRLSGTNRTLHLAAPDGD